jgi:uncharacterized protein YjbJ (UPF0337 family)
MNQDELTGTAKNVGGKVQEGIGRLSGDARTTLKGKANQAEGAAQEWYGQAKDSAEDAMDAVRGGAVTLEETLRNTIDRRPYTVVLGALALGWVLGRTGRII